MNYRKLAAHKAALLNMSSPFLRWLPGPLFLVVHVTLKCNKRCAECYQDLDPFYREHGGIMPLDRFREVIKQAKRDFALTPHIHLMGGEPTTHPEWPAILEICREQGIVPSMTTNGLLLGKQASLLVSGPLGEINLSVSISDAGEVDSRLAGHLDTFLRERATTGRRQRPSLNLNFLICPASCHYLEATADFFASEFPPNAFASFTCEHLEFTQCQRPTLHTETMDIQGLAQQMRHLRRRRYPFDVVFVPVLRECDLDRYYRSDDLFRHKCLVPQTGFAIYPDGAVTPGGAIFACNHVVGSLEAESLRCIWKGERLKRFQQELRERGLPRDCFRCCHKIYY